MRSTCGSVSLLKRSGLRSVAGSGIIGYHLDIVLLVVVLVDAVVGVFLPVVFLLPWGRNVDVVVVVVVSGGGVVNVIVGPVGVSGDTIVVVAVVNVVVRVRA